MEIVRYTKDRIPDVIVFEQRLREEEAGWGWAIDDDYLAAVQHSFDAIEFAGAISLLARVDGCVVGRIDASLIHSHFDGSVKAYLDWICVLKSYRHQGVAQQLMAALRSELRSRGIHTLVGLIAANPEARRFYRAMDDALIRDDGIWIDI